MPTDGVILGVGIATVDIVNRVAEYPPEDAEVRTLGQRIGRGGNLGNTLTVLSQLGHRGRWVGTLADDAGAALILADLHRHGIDTAYATHCQGGATPTSYICVSQASGSRTIVHHRDLPELHAEGFEAVPLADVVWVHFEGRNPPETARMIARVRRERPELPISVEIEKPRPGIEALFDGPDVLIFSRAYALASGAPTALGFLQRQAGHRATASCLLPWAEAGAFALAPGAAGTDEPIHAPAHPPRRVVDSLAAGDVFNAAAIDALLAGLPLAGVLARANRLAGFKCGREGLDGLITDARAAGLL